MGDRRSLAWPGSYNVRDLGGLPTASGRTTRFGAVIRSESPGFFEPAAWPLVEAHGVRTCVDLRSSWEVEAGPYAPPPPVQRVAAPLEEGLLDDPEFLAMGEDGRLGTALYFRPYLDRWPDRAAAALRAIGAAPPGGVVFHCERGRDRTGLIAILLLRLAGVPDEVIIADHISTDERLREHGLALGHVPLDGEDDLYRGHGTDAEATLTALLADLDVEDLLRTAGADPDETSALRARLAP
jgi:hypothetical protein